MRFLDFYQSGILQLPQGVDRFLSPAVEQLHYLVNGIVEVNSPVFVRPPTHFFGIGLSGAG